MNAVKYIRWLILFAVCVSYGQNKFELLDGDRSEKVSFDFVNNLIVLEVEVNKIPLSFIVDTGVNKPILFDISPEDSLEVHSPKDIYIKGLGGGEPLRAIHSKNNLFKIGKVVNRQQDFYLIRDANVNFSQQIGYRVHGIIGFDLFKNFIVEVNYKNERIGFYDPKQYRYRNCRNCETLPIEVEGSKAYVHGYIKQYSHIQEIPVKLLLDSGSCDALWLFENTEGEIAGPVKFFDDLLGFGLSGKIHGKRARLQRFTIGGFEVQQTKVSYPDSISLRYLNVMGDRNGSLGSEILRRFKVVFDYPNQKLTLKKNGDFNDPFLYNMSGIQLQHNGMRIVKAMSQDIDQGSRIVNKANSNYIALEDNFKFELHPAIQIAEVRLNSPADKVGLRKGDVILRVNRKDISSYSLQQVTHMINAKPGKTIQLEINRKGSNLKFAFELVKVL
ncbi:PDZ/DHR/GLGF domain-containing protein [Galbibacter marinus]|uniref:PDZ/DHR/GLGF domain-containing protein n=1 Tax=Galbibacter marinus TaxID=555500 RepID=K2QM39_9FLAO|nr:PDZ domain-containing protein [Galbibacter marinus]EKF55897.1 PDZ/DHR/GLGF domain-containing protein [Galbibacter marinus]